MDAKQYVALAKRASHAHFRDHTETGDALHGGNFAIVDDTVERPFDGPTVMRVELTPENTASEAALTRALLRSAVTVVAHDGGSEAFLAGERATGLYDHVALDALLDALLAETADGPR